MNESAPAVDPVGPSTPWARFTFEQVRAALLVDRPMVAAAGAGSGKTAVMAVRYVACLLDREGDGARIGAERVLAITFTREAAANLRLRIDATLRAALRVGRFPRIGADGGEAVLDAEELAHLGRCLDELPRAPIATFDGFCSELVASAAADLGRDPDLVPADDLAWRSYAEAAWRRLRERWAGARGDELADLVEAYGETPVRQRVEALAAQAGALDGGMVVADEEDPVAVIIATRARELAALPELIAAARARATGKTAENLRALPERLPSAPVELAAVIETLDELGATGPAKEPLQAIHDAISAPCIRKADGKRPDKGERRSRPSLAALVGYAPEHEERWLARARALAELARDFAALQAEEAERHGHAGFARIEAEALAAARHPLLRSRICRRFRHVLLDEAQDFNRLQGAFVDLLANEGARVFAVGDHRQSIYGFRHAAPELFHRWEALAEARDGGVARLAENFRSHPALVEAVKQVFAQPLLSAAFLPDHIKPGRADTGPASSRLELWRVDAMAQAEATAARASAAERSEAQAEHVAALIAASIAAGRRPDQHAVLMRGRGAMRLYAAALERRRIAYDADFPTGLYTSQECHDVEALIRLCLCAEDRFAFAVALSGPWGTLDPGDKDLLVRALEQGSLVADGVVNREIVEKTGLKQIVDALRPILASEGVAAAIRALAARPELAARYGRLPLARRRLANLALLADEESAAGRALDPAAFIARLADRRRLGADAREAGGTALGNRGVRLMTIHGAKGLEWPVVVVPECDGRFNQRDLGALVLGAPDDRDRLAIACGPGAREEGAALRRALIQERLRGRLQGEEQRLLYVACTRAVEELHLIAGDQPRGVRDDGVAGCYGDWLVGAGLEWTVRPAPTPGEPSSQAAAPSAMPLPELPIAGLTDAVTDLRAATDLIERAETGAAATAGAAAREAARVLGDTVHRALWRHGPGMSVATARRELAGLGLSGGELEALVAALADGALVPGYREAAVRLCEQPVIAELVAGDPRRLVSATCDLVLRDGRGWTLYDYKTGAAASSPASALQVLVYARMLRPHLDAPLTSAWIVDVPRRRRIAVEIGAAAEDDAWRRITLGW